MNSLLIEMKRSMEELTLGLDGSLNMSPAMEALAEAIRSNSVPARWMSQMSTRMQEVRELPEPSPQMPVHCKTTA
jgi:dynein heavy chain, axonemal